MLTAMPTVRSTSVGASVPSAIRATATSGTSPAVTHLPLLRQRPSATSVYSTPTRMSVRWVTSIDGIAQPPQLIRRSTPKGRSRRATMFSTPTRYMITFQTTSHTIRCRQRRRTSNASNSPNCSTISVHQEPTCAKPC
jgi:hypothetical protein